ncbi:hypothetical protein E2C01_064548 [Portunus trituberculatus]|uniref:Uncharacterized protein n=1 Tax=Portunus trituberculatus TaxID=210409 RepID=A0A5B7HP27_PORTR|nr:hypothetical protein [Portunus trituberculatus]
MVSPVRGVIASPALETFTRLGAAVPRSTRRAWCTSPHSDTLRGRRPTLTLTSPGTPTRGSSSSP